ncbi:MAG: N-acetylmuramic acid 6-phosphate etherase [Acidobacteria bacterium]|nr:MAG: N-acetylmuramic acid 6-phosphate etherase [Acidobacteriota bacterium]
MVQPDDGHGTPDPATTELLRRLHEGGADAVEAVGRILPDVAAAVEAVTARLRDGGRLLHVGAGTSGRLGVLDAAELPVTFGVREGLVVGLLAGGAEALSRDVAGAEDDKDAGTRDLDALGVSPRDAVVASSATGTTPYVLGAVARAREVKALTVGLSAVPGSSLLRTVDLPLLVDVGPEVPRGVTRLKAGTAQKLVLEMLTTAVMARLGRVWRDEAVAMRPTSRKLRARAARVVCDLLGLGRYDADNLLEAAGGDLPVALVAGRWKTGPDEARRRLDALSGDVARALEEPPEGMP